jgi:hypothetical protein
MNIFWNLGAVAAILFFAVGESYAFKHADRQNTLSRWIYNIGKTWPLSIWLMGMFAGGLAVHFFWHWCPGTGIGLG